VRLLSQPRASCRHPGVAVPETIEVVPTDVGADTLGDIAVGMVRARAAVAETGSVVLDGGSVGDRVVAMLSDRLVVVLESQFVVARIPSGFPSRMCAADSVVQLPLEHRKFQPRSCRANSTMSPPQTLQLSLLITPGAFCISAEEPLRPTAPLMYSTSSNTLQTDSRRLSGPMVNSPTPTRSWPRWQRPSEANQ